MSPVTSEPGDQLPLGISHRRVAFGLPESRRVAMQRLPAKGRREAAPLHRHDIMAVEGLGRSEEHTSELQSLMRIPYAVFCLKKKKKTNNLRREFTSSEAQHVIIEAHDAL